ncbi:MAG: CPBP family intramembrane metalloprotease [Bacteroidia bacterium]|nr:CPBP family intramembrane metalloprotease [Bacteroidia bacterium]
MMDEKGIHNSRLKKLLVLELLVLFVFMPVSLAFEFPGWIKASYIGVGVLYVLYISTREKWFKKKYLLGKTSLKTEKDFWYKVLFYIPVSTLIAWFVYRDQLFNMVRHHFWVWVAVCSFYSVLSVYVQEFLYRLYFFNRYENYFSEALLIGLNAIVFGLAHSMFRNVYVVGITAIGGLMISLSYRRTRSLFIACVEHAIYGCWLFTLGVGKELAFPDGEVDFGRKSKMENTEASAISDKKGINFHDSHTNSSYFVLTMKSSDNQG